jgi:hypothetical protein
MTFNCVGKNRRSPATAALFAMFALFTGGCYKATGGGYIPSMTGADKASFGFAVMCRTDLQNGIPEAVFYEGQLEWHDGPVRFHGDAEPDFLRFPGRCQDVRQMMLASRGGPLQFNGTYKPKSGGEGGVFFATVVDMGTPGGNGDVITIELFDGEYHGYANAGTLQGGNIQVFGGEIPML